MSEIEQLKKELSEKSRECETLKTEREITTDSAIECALALGLTDDDPRTLIQAAKDLRSELSAFKKQCECDDQVLGELCPVCDKHEIESLSLRKQLAEKEREAGELRGKLNREVENHDAMRDQLNAALANLSEIDKELFGDTLPYEPDRALAIRTRNELSERSVKMETALRKITRHQTEMGGSFNEWHKEIVDIAFEGLKPLPQPPEEKR